MSDGVHEDERDPGTGQFSPEAGVSPEQPSQSLRGGAAAQLHAGYRRVRRLIDVPSTRAVAAIVAACYLSALLAVNLATGPVFNDTPLNWVATHLFPRIGTSSDQIDIASIQAEWDDIQANYFIRGAAGRQATQGAESGMVAQFQSAYHDRWTMVLTPDQYRQAFGEPLSGQRSGSIGVSIDPRCGGGTVCASNQTPTEILITEVLVNQPADRAGLKRGDVLVAVGGTKVSSLAPYTDADISKLSSLVRGTPGTTVSLTVLRGTQTLTLTATRENLSIPSVYATRMGGILYIEVTDFGSDTGDLVTSLVKKYAPGTTGVILDLRDNGGGYVDATPPLVSQFVAPGPGGDDVVVRRGRMNTDMDPSSAQVIEHDRLVSGGLLTSTNIPMVVLVNGDTASAAEICTEALRDYHRATVLGVKTFGKGSVQTNFTLPDGNVLHLTIERWYGPNGETIDGNGITPDDVVALANPDDRYRLDVQSGPASADTQLEAALSLLHAG